MKTFTHYVCKVLGVALVLFLAGSEVFAATYYSKGSATNFASTASWGLNLDGSGTAPASITNADDYVIANSAALTLNANAAVRTLTINTGSLTVAANTLTVSLATGNTSTLSLSSTSNFTVTGTGTVNVNGNMALTAGGIFTQSGGDINVDGNNAGAAATSVAAATSLVNLAGSPTTIFLTGGTLTVVDPHANSSSVYAFTCNASTPINSGTSHTLKFGNGVSTDPGFGGTGFYMYLFPGSSYLILGNVLCDNNVTSINNRQVSTFNNIGILGNLTINSGGEYRVSSTTYLSGNLVNNGLLTTTSTLNFGSYFNASVQPTNIAQTISGSGLFRNNGVSASSTANFASLTFNNASTSGVSFTAANGLLTTTGGITNTGTIATTLTFTTCPGGVNLNGGTFTQGISTTTPGTTSFTAGGFRNGTFRKWFGISTLPVSLPSTSVGNFPFVQNGANRNFQIASTNASLPAGGTISVTYTSGTGFSTVAGTDPSGSFAFNRLTNPSWTVATGDGFAVGVAATPFIVNASADGIIQLTAITNEPRLVQSAAAGLGTHVAPTGSVSSPVGNRNLLSLANLASTYTFGFNSANLPASPVYSVASGAWDAGSTWSTGVAPLSTDAVVVSVGNTVTVNAAASVASTIVINGTLTVSGSTLIVTASTAATGVTMGSFGILNISGGAMTVGTGTTRYSTLSTGTALSSQLNVSSGSLTVNGNINIQSPAYFSQTSGTITVDGNDAAATATSVAAGTSIFTISTINISVTGGTLIIVDPHASITASTTSSAFRGNASVPTNFGTGHTTQFGNGTSTDNGGSTNGFLIYTFAGSSYTQLGTVIVSGSAGGTNRQVVTSSAVGILGNLTVNSAGTTATATGEFRIGVTTLYLNGNLTVNSPAAFTTASTSGLYLADFSNASTGTPLNATGTQTISGNGVFRNNIVSSSSTGGFGNLTIRNTNASSTAVTFSGNALLTPATAFGGTTTANSGTVSGVLNLIAGNLTTGAGTFVLGFTANNATLAYTAGGFTTGSTFARQFATTTLNGTTITASTAPSTSGAGTYPFISGTFNRFFYLNKTLATTGGAIAVTFTDGSGVSAIGAVVDGGYSIDRQSALNWVVSTPAIAGVTFAAGAATFDYAASGSGSVIVTNTNARLMKVATVVGSNQVGTNLPVVQRITIPAANYTGTFYIGQSSADVPIVSTVTGGAWETGGSWVGGVSPSGCTPAIIVSGATITVNAAAASAGSLNLNSGGLLNLTGNTLTIGCANNNSAANINGALIVAGGNFTINGNLAINNNANFTHSSGTITIDGNDNSGTTGNANSVASGTPLFALGISGTSYGTGGVTALTGGTIIIVDPHIGSATSTSAYSVYGNLAASSNVNSAATHTIQFGNGASASVGSAAAGFVWDGYVGTGRLNLGSVTVNAGAVATRIVTQITNTNSINGNLTVTSGTYTQNALTTNIGGNISVATGSTFITNGTVIFALGTGTGTVAQTTAQSVSVAGTGAISNLAASPTGNFTTATINNTSATGVTFGALNNLTGAAGFTGASVTGTLTFNGFASTSGVNGLLWGTSSSQGTTLTVTSGGMLSGSTFARGWTVGQTGGTITAAANPSSTTSQFPFIDAPSTVTGNVRHAWIERTLPTATGILAVKYANNGSTVSTVSFTDGAYNLNRQFSGTWDVSTYGTTPSATSYELAVSAPNAFGTAPSNGNVRLTALGSAIGTQQAGTTLPNAQRVLTLAQMTAQSFYQSIDIADVPFASVANGDWSTGSTWNKGVAPTSADVVTIQSIHTVAVTSAGQAASTLALNGILNVTGGDLSLTATTSGTGLVVAVTTGQINVSAGTVTIGTGANRFSTLTNNGLLAVSGTGTLTVNGNINNTSTATFNQSGGNINIDGNAGGVSANSVPSGTRLLAFAALNSAINLTGGTLTIVDPHANTTATEAIYYTNGTAGTQTSTVNHTTRFGDGTSTDAGGNAAGFLINNWVSTAYISLGNILVGGPAGTNRLLTSTYQLAAVGDLTVNSGGIISSTATFVVGKNLVNNAGGAILNTAGVLAGLVASNTGSTLTFGPVTIAQTISGSGLYNNSSYVSTAGATSSGTNITVTSTTGLLAGMPVLVSSGIGQFPTGTTVSSITSSTVFVASNAPTVALSGGASVVTSGTANLASLQIYNSNASSVTLSTGSPLYMTGALIFTQGVLNTSTNNELTYGTTTGVVNSNAFVGNGATAYVNGPFRRVFASSSTLTGASNANAQFYPVGVGATYLPAHINAATGATAGGAIISVTAASAAGGSLGGSLSAPLSNDNWNITASGPSTVGNVNIGVTSTAATASVYGIANSATSGGVYDLFTLGTFNSTASSTLANLYSTPTTGQPFVSGFYRIATPNTCLSGPTTATASVNNGATVCQAANSTRAFSVSNSPNQVGYTYQWLSSSNASSGFANVANYVSAAGATNSTTTITVGSTTGLFVGMVVTVTSGTGTFNANTTVATIPNATTFTVSSAPSVALSASAVVTGTATGASLTTQALTTVGSLYFQVSVGCQYGGTATLSQTPAPGYTVVANPTASITPSNSGNYCGATGNAVTLTANPSGGTGPYTKTWSAITGLWQDPAGSVTAYTALLDLSPVYARPASTTTYTLTVTDANSCTATSTQAVTVVAPPALTTTATPSAICSGTSSVLGVSAASSSAASSYTFGASSGTFTPISGTLITSGTAGNLDSYAQSTATTIPSFTFAGTAYTTAWVTSNGLLNLGGAAPSGTNYNAISGTTGSGISIMPLQADLWAGAAAEIRYEQIGNELVWEWKNFQRYISPSGTSSELFSFQARLDIVSGVIKFVYGDAAPVFYTATTLFPVIGIRTSTTDYKNLSIGTGAETWASPLNGTTNTDVCRLTTTAVAKTFTSGQTYTFSPPVATYTYAWSPGGFIASGGATASATTTNLGATQAYSVLVTNSSTGCQSTGNTSVTVTPVAVAPTITAPAASNYQYNFSYATNGSLDDLTAGSTSMITGPVSSATSTVTAIGFNMVVNGVTYTHFSANAAGQMELHTGGAATAISSANLSAPAANRMLLFPMAGNNRTVGSVRFKLSGVSGTQTLVVEWKQFEVSTTSDLINAGNMQVRIREATGTIEYVYGEMYNANSVTLGRSIGLSYSNTATTAGYVTIGATPTLTNAATFTTNSFPAGSGTTTGSPLLPNLGSLSDGSRVVYSFTPTSAVYCSDGVWQLNANLTGGTGPYIYTWTGAGLSATNIANPTVSNAPSGSYSLTVTDACPGPGTATGGPVTRTVFNTPVPTITPTLGGSYCNPNGTLVTLAGTGTGTYVWDANSSGVYTQMFTTLPGGTAYTGGNQSNVFVSPTTGITYRLRVTSSGCTGSATQAVSVAPGVTITTFTSAAASICPSTSYPLNVVPSVSGGAGAANYTFGASSGTFTPISGTLITSGTAGNLDSYAQSTATTIPSFTFAGTAYTTAWVTSNGLLNLGGAAPSGTNYNAISGTTGSGISIMPLQADLWAGAAAEIRYEQIGNELVWEWKNFQRYISPSGTSSELFSFQARLDIVSGVIKFVYGDAAPVFYTATTLFPVIGIRTSTTDYKNLSIGTGAETWASPLNGTTNTDVCRLTTTAVAKTFTSGQTYTFTPPAPASFTYSWTPVGSPAALNDLGVSGVTTTNIASPIAGEGSNGPLQNPSAPAADIYSYNVLVTNTGNGCTANRVAAITVQSVPLVVNDPTASTTATCQGTAVVLTGTSRFSGGCQPFTYKWKENGVNIANYVSVAGATSASTTVTVTSTTGLLPGMTVTVTSGVGAFAANTKVLTVPSATTFTVSAVPTTALSGGASVVTGAAAGSAALPSTANTLTVSPTVTSTYKLEITDNDGQVLTSATGVTITVTNPQPSGLSAATRCGVGTTQLTGSPGSGSLLKWYTAPTGGTYVGQGSPVTSPEISATTTYYAEASATVGGSANGNIGAGVSTGSGSGYNPFHTFFGGYKTQHIFRASELLAAGMTAGDITSISYDITSVGSNLSGFSMNVGFTSQATATTTAITTGLTQVYSNASESFAVGIKSFPFSTPMNWDGISNLVVSICWSNNNTGGTNSQVRYGTTAFTSSMALYADNNTVAQICGATTTADLTGGISATSSNRPNVILAYQPLCSGTRVAVIATVTPPPALATSADQINCNDAVGTATIPTGGGATYNTYVWSPAAGLFTDGAGTAAYDGTSSIQTIYPRTTTVGLKKFWVTGTQTGGAQCVNVDTLYVQTQPAVAGASTTALGICISGTGTLSLSPLSGYVTGTVNWLSSPNNSIFTSVATATTYTTPVLTSASLPLWYRVEVKNGLGANCFAQTIPVTVTNPTLTSYAGATRCGAGTVNLSALAPIGQVVRFFDAASGGNVVKTSPTFASATPYQYTTPSISASTNYWVSAGQGLTDNVAIGTAATILPGGTFPQNGGPFGGYFEGSRVQYLIRASELSNAGMIAGNINSLAFDITASTTGVLKNYTIKVAPTNASSTSGGFITESFSTVYLADYTPIVGQNVFPFSSAMNWNGVDNILVDICFDNDPTGTLGTQFTTSASFRYTLTTFSSSFWGYADNTLMCGVNVAGTQYIGSYRPNIVFNAIKVCETARQILPVTINTAPTVSATASPNIVCEGGTSILQATSSNAAYTYSWDPGAVAGASFIASPLNTTVYTVTATDNTAGPFAGCVATTTASLFIRPIPAAPTVTPTTAQTPYCAGTQSVNLTANTPSGIATALSQNFDASSSGWTIVNNHTAGLTDPKAAWNYVTGSSDGVAADGYLYPGFIPATFKTTQGGKYATAFGDAGGSGLTARTQLISPVFSTQDMTSLVLTFQTVYAYYSGGAEVSAVEVTKDGGTTWTTLTNFSTGATSVGSIASPSNRTINLPVTFENESSVQLRFRYESTWGYFWLVDDVQLKGNLAIAGYKWAAGTGTALPAPAKVSAPANSSVSFIENAGTWSYTGFSTNVFGCVSPASTTGSFTIKARPTAVLTANDFICQGQTANVGIYLTGPGPWNMQYSETNPNSTVTVNNQAVSPYPFSYVAGATARTFQVTALQDLTTTCTSLPIDLGSLTIDVPIPCEISWTGASSTSWNIPGNWSNFSVPSQFTSVVIPGTVVNQPLISGITATVANFNLVSAPATDMGLGGILNVKGNVTGTGLVKGVGKVVLNGTGQQNVSGSFTVSNIDFANLSGTGVVIGGTLRVEPTAATGTGLVTFLNNSRLTTTGQFILGSNALATAKIGPMPATTFITGNTTMERYLPYTSGVGTWYFLGSPMTGKNFTDYVDDFSVTGLTSGFGAQGGNINSSVEPERSTIFKYVEASHNQRLDTVQKIGWTIPPNENIFPGKGYRVWVKHYSNSQHKLDNIGPFVQGDFNFPLLTRTELSGCVPVSYPCQETSWRGWNLLANPYPCDVDWDATGTAWSKPAEMGANPAWWRWHASAGGYGVYTTGVYAGTTPAPANPNLIPSSQAFFIRLSVGGTYNRTMSLKETAKLTTTSGQFLRVNANQEKIRVGLSQSNDPLAYGYDAVIRFMPDATDGYDLSYDFANLGGNNFYLSVPVESEQMSIASYGPITESKIIPITTTYSGNYGNYVLKFSEMDNLLTTNAIYLRDNLLGSLEPINVGYTYSYTAYSTDAIINNRFELVFSTTGITGTIPGLAGVHFGLYPNPTAGKSVNLSLSGVKDASGHISILDVLGKEVYSEKMDIKQEGLTQKLLDINLASGMYTVKMITKSQTFTEKLIVR